VSTAFQHFQEIAVIETELVHLHSLETNLNSELLDPARAVLDLE